MMIGLLVTLVVLRCRAIRPKGPFLQGLGGRAYIPYHRTWGWGGASKAVRWHGAVTAPLPGKRDPQAHGVEEAVESAAGLRAEVVGVGVAGSA